MNLSKNINLLFFAIIGGAVLMNSALNKGYLNDAELTRFDTWFCEQSIFVTQAHCKQNVINEPSLRYENQESSIIRFDDAESLAKSLGNWEMTDSLDSRFRGLKEIIAVNLFIEKENFKRTHEVSLLTGVYAKYWTKYPKFIASVKCISCGNQRSVLRKLSSTVNTNNNFLTNLALNNPQMLNLIANGQNLPSKNMAEISLMAELLYNGGTHSLISNVMIENKNWEMLQANIINGGGYGAFSDVHLDQVPLELVISAWERSLSGGRFEPRMTQYLLMKGYRPALRLVVWLRAGEYDYLKYSQANKITPMINSGTDFGYLKGRELAQYYSENWRNISWDNKNMRWLTSNK